MTVMVELSGDRWLYVPTCAQCGRTGAASYMQDAATLNDRLHTETCQAVRS